MLQAATGGCNMIAKRNLQTMTKICALLMLDQEDSEQLCPRCHVWFSQNQEHKFSHSVQLHTHYYYYYYYSLSEESHVILMISYTDTQTYSSVVTSLVLHHCYISAHMRSQDSQCGLHSFVTSNVDEWWLVPCVTPVALL